MSAFNLSDFRMFVIYDNPTDYPGKLVVRGWTIKNGQPQPIPDDGAWQADTLEEARQCVPHGLVRMAPHPSDDPKIAEVWL